MAKTPPVEKAPPRRLFVDCDDTLVLWGEDEEAEEGGVYHGDLYTPNNTLINTINAYLATNPNVELIVWSGGGKGYAAMWANKFFAEETWRAMDKVPWGSRFARLTHLKAITAGDMVIDDQPITVPEGASLYTWQEFVNAY